MAGSQDDFFESAQRPRPAGAEQTKSQPQDDDGVHFFNDGGAQGAAGTGDGTRPAATGGTAGVGGAAAGAGAAAAAGMTGGRRNIRNEPIPKTTFGATPGNYIFTIGKPGSGKSTLQSHLLNYLYNGEEFQITEDLDYLKTEEERAELHRLRVLWDDMWRNGNFPKSTTSGRPSQYRFILTPTNKPRFPSLPFGFFEISGEDFKALYEIRDEPPQLLSSIDSFLKNPECRIAFLFVCQGNDVERDDLLFAQFLTYLGARIDPSIKQRSSAAIVLADPDECQKRLQLARREPPVGGKLEARAFVNQFVRQTANQLATWDNRAAITAFSVGKTAEAINPQNGLAEPYIKDPSFDNARHLAQWLYGQFTGRSLGPNAWQRWVASMNRLGGG